MTARAVMVTGIGQDGQRKPLDSAAKALMHAQLKGLDLAPSIVHLPDEHPADEALLDAERKDALTDIQQVLPNLSPIPIDIANKITALSSAGSVSKIRKLKTEIQQDIKQAIERNDQDKNLTASELLHDVKYQALWSDFHKCEIEIQDEFERLYRRGKITETQMQYLRTERERLDVLPEDSDARLAGEKDFTEYQKELGIRVKDEAHKRGERDIELSADKVVHGVDEQVRRLEEMHKLRTEVQKEKHQKTSEAKASMHMSDDEQLSTDSTPAEKQGLAVVSVTLNDIHAPTGSKGCIPQQDRRKDIRL